MRRDDVDLRLSYEIDVNYSGCIISFIKRSMVSVTQYTEFLTTCNVRNISSRLAKTATNISSSSSFFLLV